MSIKAPNDAAREIIERAFEPSTYQKMAESEAETWGKVAVDGRRAEIVKDEQEAARVLGLNEGRFGFFPWCRQRAKTFQRGLSIGCGGGRAERQMIKAGICKSFHGVDIAEHAIGEAQRLAAEGGFDCTYEVGDINFTDFGTEKFDLVVAQSSIHHVVHLEDVFAAIRRALVPGGILWLHDYVGESQFQHSDERLEVANGILGILPERFRMSRLTGKPIEKIVRKAPGTLASPFESIRSGEILPVALENLKQMGGWASCAVMHLVFPIGTRANYLVDDAGRALFKMIKQHDDMLTRRGIIPGTDGRFVFVKE